jgi:hypothetical protein
MSQKTALVMGLLKSQVRRSMRSSSLFPAGLLLLLSGLGLNDSSNSPGETNLCGTAVTNGAFAALQPMLQPATSPVIPPFEGTL